MTLSGCVDLSPIKTTTTTSTKDSTTVHTKDTTIVTNPKITYGSVTDIDGNVYKTITIGTQTWMAENLKVIHYRDGSAIPNVTGNTAWASLTSGGWCDYSNSSTNGSIYGHLYNWYAATDTRNIAPTGWHVPSDAEWKVLESYLISNGYNFDGTTTGNKLAKSLAATVYWMTDTSLGSVANDVSKNNKSGFTGLPCGYRYPVNGLSYALGSVSVWWSSTNKYNIALEADKNMSFSFVDGNAPSDGYKSYGFAIRCIKDTVSSTSGIPTNGLVAYYPFSGNANDVSGNGNNGTVVGATLTTDRFNSTNGAYSFNGSSNYISIANTPSLQNINSFSLTFWFCINQWQFSNSNYWFATIEKPSQYSTELLKVGADSASVFGIKIKINPTTWNHLAFSYANKVLSVYSNGIYAGNTNITFISSTQPIYIGKDPGGLLEYTNGKIDDIAIYNRVLTQDDITALYNAK
jgi:uncharacterized protein (TIGR02145 family)